MKTSSPISKPAAPNLKPASAQHRPTSGLSAFNPALPEDGALIIAEVLRDQFNALNDDIQTRATEVTLAAEVASLEAQIQDRPTTPEVSAAISTAVGDKATLANLSQAISGTAQNPSNLNPLQVTISEPPTQAEVQQMVDWMNNLLAALYRVP